MEYREQYQNYLGLAENTLESILDEYLPPYSRVGQAARYSLMSGGKRVRAILVLAGCDLFGGDLAKAARIAAAVEMLHCYSLIHDDLPCMDDDDYRRGKLSCHVAYDYPTAVLAGDALLTEAFRVIADTDLPAEQKIEIVNMLSLGGGLQGMVYGQELDLEAENAQIDLPALLKVHRHKTGALIRSALLMGAITGGAAKEQLNDLTTYANGIGLVFQIIDDILDVTSTSEELGKPVGSDKEEGKSTFITLLGVEKSFEYAQNVNNSACDAIRSAYGDKADFLVSLAQNLLNRKK